jgi:hypothetical protein
MRIGLTLAVLAAVVVAGAPLRAQPASEALAREAERRNQRAHQLYERGQYDRALQLYQAAFDLHPAARYLFNIGLAREKTFDYEGCAQALREVRERDDTEDEVRERAAAAYQRCAERAVIPVQITSAPTNAAVHLGEGDARALRGRTPLSLELPPGEHTLRLELDGFVAQTRPISIDIGERKTADFVLERLASLRIDVEPPDAQVRLDDGELKPAPIADTIAPGAYELRVEREGYHPLTRTIEALPGSDLSLMLSLTPLPQRRTLGIRSTVYLPPGGGVWLDGESLGRPPVRSETSPGSHRIEVRAPGYVDYQGTFTVPEDRDLTVRVSLAPERTTSQRRAIWALGGTASGTGLIGAIYGALALRDHARFSSRPSIERSERGRRRAEQADYFLGTAFVLGTAALVSYVMTRPGDSSAWLETPARDER